MMRKGIKVTLDPTPRQARLLASNAGAARFVFNLGLMHVKSQLNGLTSCEGKGKADWSMPALRRWWNEWKQELAPWWRENSKEAYTSGLQSLANAFANYFAWRDGEREGDRMGWPKPRSKNKTTPKFTYTTGSFGVADPYGLKLPRVGRVHCMENVGKLTGGIRPSRMTISRHNGRWYASLLVEVPDPQPSTTLQGHVGVDLGVKRIATLSDGTTVENPHTLKASMRRQRRIQRKLNRRKQGSKRWVEAKHELQKVAAQVARQRRDRMDKLTTMLATTYRDISIEDLNVKGMTKRPKAKENPDNPGQYLPNGRKAKAGLNREILDAGFGTFRRMLEYKCALSGARLHIVNRWYPSSRTCSNCGAVKAKLSLKERVYVCDQCGLVIDRDHNAAINIDVAGSAPETLNACGGCIRPGNPGRHPKDPSSNTGRKHEPSSEKRIRLGADTRKSVLQTKTN